MGCLLFYYFKHIAEDKKKYMSWLSIILLSLLGLFLIFVFVLCPLYIYFIRNIIKNTNRGFIELVRTGNLSEARQLFEKAVGAIPSALEFNPLLMQAAVDLKNVDSPQKKEQLQEFFSELADIYLKESPDSGFVKMFAAGLRERNSVRLREIVEESLEEDSSLQAYSFASMIMQNRDICLSINYSIAAMHQLLNQKRLSSKTFASVMNLIIDNLFKAGLYNTALQCCELCLSRARLRDHELYFLKAVKWRILDLLAKNDEIADELAASDMTKDICISLLPLFVFYALRADNSRLALDCIRRLKEAPGLKLPQWCSDVFSNQINIISFLQCSAKDPQSRKSAAVPDYLIKNLKETADTYSSNKLVQIITADALYCAGSYIQALMYLQRSQKLRSEILIAESAVPDFEACANEGSSAYMLSLPEKLPYLSGYSGENELMYHLLIKLHKEEDALPFAVSRCKAASERSPEKALWQLRVMQLQRNNGESIEEKLQNTENSLADYQSGNHIEAPEVMPEKTRSESSGEEEDLIESLLEKDFLLGELQFHYALAECIRLQNQPDSDEKRLKILSRVFESRPGSNLLIRLTVPLAAKLGRRSLLQRLSDALKACAVSMEDIEALRLADEALNILSSAENAPADGKVFSAPDAPAGEDGLEDREKDRAQNAPDRADRAEADLLQLLKISEQSAENALKALEGCQLDRK